MIIVTGGAGFIGSALIWKLNEQGISDILVADRFGTGPKWKNLTKRATKYLLHKNDLFPWLDAEGLRTHIDAVFHLGASSSTVETDVDYLVANNVNYSVRLWNFCTEYSIPFIYASSASTYGAGDRGFSDADTAVPNLRPLNPYGFSKQKFDQWAVREERTPPFWAGLKFFNVYGPQEYHKGSQASVVPQFVPQAQKTGSIRLFKSYKTGYADGEQLRDFVYVKDIVEVIWHLFANRTRAASGIYNVGSGRARTWNDLAKAVFNAIGMAPRIEYIEMPESLRSHYQYFTEAPLDRLREKAGFTASMTSLEQGVEDYIRTYLLGPDAYL